MASIFVAVPGRAVVAAKNHGPRGLLFSLPNGGSLGGVVTRLSASQQVAVQMVPSLDRAFYIMPFGDQAGSMSVGLMLNSLCDQTSGAVDSFLRYYRNQRLTPDNATPSTMAIGSSTFFGYALGFEMSAESQSGHVIHGTLSFVAWMAL